MFSGTYTCQVTAANPNCHIGYQDYRFDVVADPTPRLSVSTELCPTPVLLDPQNSPTDSVPIGIVDTDYTASGNFNPFFQCSTAGGGFCGINGTFMALGTCP